MATAPVAVLAGVLQGGGGGLTTWFEEFLANLVDSYGRLPVSAVVLVVAVLVGMVVIPAMVRGIKAIAAVDPLTDRAGSIASRLRTVVPTTFSELLVRTAQITVAIVATLAVIVVWGYGDRVVALRRAIASDIGDVLGLSLTMVLISMAFVGSDLFQRAIGRLGESAPGITDHQQEIALRIAQITLFLTLGAAILTLWNFDLSGLLVGAGFLGIVVGFASRETLGSLVAGFVLMFSRPFTIGDWVEIGEAEGTITDITMFNTRMQNIDAETLVIPNDVVSNSTIVNRSQRGRLQIRREVGVDYGSDPETATEIAVDAMETVEEVIDSPEPRAIPVRFDDSGIVIELRFWIKDPSPQRKWAAIADVLREVKAAFEREGIDIPFPQRTLSSRDGDHATVALSGDVREDGADGVDDGEDADGGTGEDVDGETGDGAEDGSGEDSAEPADGDDRSPAKASMDRDDASTDGESSRDASTDGESSGDASTDGETPDDDRSTNGERSAEGADEPTDDEPSRDGERGTDGDSSVDEEGQPDARNATDESED